MPCCDHSRSKDVSAVLSSPWLATGSWRLGHKRKGNASMSLTRRGLLCGSLGVTAAGLRTTPTIAPNEPIRFGWLTALTGPNSAAGIGFNRAVVYAVNKINASGGINGR